MLLSAVQCGFLGFCGKIHSTFQTKGGFMASLLTLLKQFAKDGWIIELHFKERKFVIRDPEMKPTAAITFQIILFPATEEQPDAESYTSRRMADIPDETITIVLIL